MNIELKKRQSDIGNKKMEAQEIKKKTMGRFGETRKHKSDDESDTGIKTK